MEFKIGDKVVYPNHGIGIIEEIRIISSDGMSNGSFYRLRILANDSTVMVPAANINQVGLRRVIARKEIQKVYGILEDGQIASHSNWKGRFQDNSNRMRTGEILEVAAVLKNLSLLSQKKNLSYRERRMLDKARYLVVSEIAEVEKVAEAVVEEKVEKAVARSLKNVQDH
ncbi:MAG TPA: CarD family transcriptional regulator [Candidatus Polarisedimenticolia bacterium]|nr:CarD family transcriptional regulator [Candidatus Polarisedimenticolia bacterium]